MNQTRCHYWRIKFQNNSQWIDLISNSAEIQKKNMPLKKSDEVLEK